MLKYRLVFFKSAQRILIKLKLNKTNTWYGTLDSFYACLRLDLISFNEFYCHLCFASYTRAYDSLSVVVLTVFFL